jgi:Mg-chelatase subunit ChlD
MASTDEAVHGALLRWRLVLGAPPTPAWRAPAGSADAWDLVDQAIGQDERLAGVDRSLGFLYGDGPGGYGSPKPGSRQGGMGDSMPYVPRWLGDIRRYFPTDVVSFMQKEAIDRKGLRGLVMEPEVLKTLEKDVGLLATILTFQAYMPDQTKETARQVVREIVNDLRQRLESQVRQAVLGALQRSEHSPMKSARNLDVRRTVRDALQHYQPELGTVVPERVYFFANEQRFHEWRIVIVVDQSGSMSESIVYASIFAAVFASLPALDTRLIFFDTNVVDVSEHLADPVDVLFSTQLGGGTDINRAVRYAASLISEPEKTIFVLISDLFEGGVAEGLLQQLAALKESHVKAMCVLALNDAGRASYDHDLARQVAALDIPAFAATPNKLVDAVERAIKGELHA